MIEVKEIKSSDNKYVDETLQEVEVLLRTLYAKAKTDGVVEGIKVHRENNLSYNDGLEDAWNCARKLILSPYIFKEALDETEVYSIFHGLDGIEVLGESSAKDAINAIKEYEHKRDKKGKKGKDINAPTKKDVAIGDEVRNLWGTVGVVVGIPPQSLPVKIYSVTWWNFDNGQYCTTEWVRDEFVLLNKKEEK